MKIRKLLFVLPILLCQCITEPDFPIVPSIKFTNVIFKDLQNQADSLIVTIDFQDGDGDLGLDKDESFPPYNDKFYFIWNNTSKTAVRVVKDPFSEFENWTIPPITYSDRFDIPELDTLPSFIDPYSCINWEVVNNYDTVYYQPNKFHHNILVDYLIKQPNGEFIKFEWEEAFTYPNCGISYDGRFPLLQPTNRNKPLEGSIRYGMTSVGFKSLFSLKTLKLRITIIDRDLNVSNTVESPPFTLQEITVN